MMYSAQSHYKGMMHAPCAVSDIRQADFEQMIDDSFLSLALFCGRRRWRGWSKIIGLKVMSSSCD
jgi:hypothetical protein